MGIFGWDLPPGVSMRDIDPVEGPCDCCGMNIDDCICPECPQCGDIGNPGCYGDGGHGLHYSDEQIASLRERQQLDREQWEADCKADERYAAQLEEERKAGL